MLEASDIRRQWALRMHGFDDNAPEGIPLA
jgi:hypothetical protein